MFQAMEANNEFAATLEKRLQDVPRSDELYEIKKVVRELKLGLKMAQDRERANVAQLAAAEKLGNQAASLEARLRVVSNERKSALEQVSFLEAKVESSANKFSDDLRRATYDAKKALADSYLDVLVSLKEKWEKKKAATDCEARLREVMANIARLREVMANIDLLKKILNNNLLASDELLRLRTKEVELGSFNKEGVVSPGLFVAIFMFMRGRSFGAVSRFVVDTFNDGFDVTKDFVS